MDPEANIIVGSTLDTAMEGGMRVSVVATGIDATEKTSDVPVARRSMSEPLTRTVSAEEPVREEAPAAAEVAEAAPQMPENREPSLFEATEEPAQFQPRDEQDDDGLPPPAYQPRVAEFEPQPEPVEQAADAYAAQPHAAGTPSPEALQRLQAAVQNVPSAAQRLTATRSPEPAPQPQAEAEERPRFGFNRLIDRMTGHAADTPAQPVRQQPAMRQADATAPAHEEADPDQERIEIPAFLRRQAN